VRRVHRSVRAAHVPLRAPGVRRAQGPVVPAAVDSVVPAGVPAAVEVSPVPALAGQVPLVGSPTVPAAVALPVHVVARPSVAAAQAAAVKVGRGVDPVAVAATSRSWRLRS